jgi:hypothetical protein
MNSLGHQKQEILGAIARATQTKDQRINSRLTCEALDTLRTCALPVGSPCRHG